MSAMSNLDATRSKELYNALAALCQHYGFTSDVTYDHLHDAVDSIREDEDEDDDEATAYVSNWDGGDPDIYLVTMPDGMVIRANTHGDRDEHEFYVEGDTGGEDHAEDEELYPDEDFDSTVLWAAINTFDKALAMENERRDLARLMGEAQAAALAAVKP